MKPKTQKDALKRLAYIEGHLNGVRKMIEEDRYCIDVLKQMHAIRKSIEKLEALLLEGDEDEAGEDRFVLLGMSAVLRLLVVCHCYREEDALIRLIPARKANRSERRQYEERRR